MGIRGSRHGGRTPHSIPRLCAFVRQLGRSGSEQFRLAARQTLSIPEQRYLTTRAAQSSRDRHAIPKWSSMIDHVNIGVADVAASRAFYEHALAPLGYTVLMERSGTVGLGSEGKPDFWISDRPSSAPLHVAFGSPDRATVDAFHEAALVAGGSDNGPPGVRPAYHAAYYGAFVLDPDGNNVEAVTHRRER